MGWGDPVVGGVDLRRVAIQSPNYLAGSTGWTINQDGSVEFNNGTFRGTVTAGTFQGTDFVINSSGEFFYSGAPALGNLIASIAPVAGTDAQGNAYPVGITTYDRANNRFVNMQSSVITIGALVGGAADIANAAQLFAGSANLTLESVHGGAGFTDQLAATLFSGDTGKTTGSTGPALQLLDALTTSDADLTVSGSVYKTQQNGNAYTWQTPSLGTGWSAGSIRSTRPLQYKLDPLDNLVITGAASVTSTTPATTVFTVAGVYVANSAQTFLVHHETSGGSLVNICTGFFNAGNIQIFSPGTITIGDIFTFNATLPLGHLS